MRNHTYSPISSYPSRQRLHGTTATVESDCSIVSIYAKPSSHSKVIGSAPCGAQLTVLGRQAEWHAVRYGPCHGFISGDSIVLNY